VKRTERERKHKIFGLYIFVPSAFAFITHHFSAPRQYTLPTHWNTGSKCKTLAITLNQASGLLRIADDSSFHLATTQ